MRPTQTKNPTNFHEHSRKNPVDNVGGIFSLRQPLKNFGQFTIKLFGQKINLNGTHKQFCFVLKLPTTKNLERKFLRMKTWI